jgi:hypothetical protein
MTPFIVVLQQFSSMFKYLLVCYALPAMDVAFAASIDHARTPPDLEQGSQVV